MNEGSGGARADELADEACSCDECRTHGQRTRLLMGLDHQVVMRADGTATAWTTWSEAPRRSPIRFDAARGGGLVPTDRGARRVSAIREVEPILRGHGVPLVAQERHGPTNACPPSQLVAEVDQLRGAGQTADAACRAVATRYGYKTEPIDSFKRRYYAYRHQLANAEPATRSNVLPWHPRGPGMLQWARRIQKATGTETLKETFQQMRDVFGWTEAELLDQIVGRWRATPDGWVKIEDPE